MNWELIKHKFCRLVVTASLLLGGVMVSAAASGTMPLWAALLGLFAAVVMLNPGPIPAFGGRNDHGIG